MGFVAVWWLFYQFGVLNFEHFVSPWTTIVEFAGALAGQPLTEGGDTIYLHAAYSAVRVAVGVGIAAILAIPLGLVVGTSQRWENLVYPAFEALRPIPPIAWLPIAIIVFPAVAIGSVSIPLSALFVVFIGAFFPIYTNTIEGARNVESEYRRAAESLGASQTNVFRHVVLPATLPAIITGLSLGVGLGWITVVAAELVTGGPGIGYIIIQASRLLNNQAVVIGMVASARSATRRRRWSRRSADGSVPCSYRGSSPKRSDFPKTASVPLTTNDSSFPHPETIRSFSGGIRVHGVDRHAVDPERDRYVPERLERTSPHPVRSVGARSVRSERAVPDDRTAPGVHSSSESATGSKSSAGVNPKTWP